MKQVEIKSGKFEMLLVDLPETELDFLIKKSGEISVEDEKGDVLFSTPSGWWHYFGKILELNEGHWKGIVEQKDKGYGVLVNKDYVKDRFTHSLFTASESGLSLLKANGVEVTDKTHLFIKKK